MTLPTEPGVYEDKIGDLWELHEDGHWQWRARRLPFGGLAPEDGVLVDPDAMARDARTPESQLLPLRRITAEDLPPESD
jgi:hypothetical protein